MATAKRRRGIGIKKWIVAALKERASSEGLKSHTQVAKKIWTGKLDPLNADCRRFKSDFPDGSQGVSMREDLWLAIKVYAERRGKDESAQQVANKMLVGKADPIPADCIARGKEWTAEREKARVKEGESNPIPKKKAAPKPKKPKKTKSEEIVEEREAREDREGSFGRRKRKLSTGSAPDPQENERRERTITPDVEILGGVFYL